MGSVVWLALGLSMDATAASASRGLLAERIRVRDALKVALLFGGAQALMPYLGFVIGVRLGPLIEAWDHWVAFTLLLLVGGHMLLEAAQATWQARRARSQDEPDPARAATAKRDAFELRVLCLLALATSIDALAAGIALPTMRVPLAPALAVIGLTTAVLSVCGLYAGRKLGAALGARLDAFGGVVLIALGTKILLEHLRSS
jgi:putative Mn2+ efflux pump MntP